MTITGFEELHFFGSSGNDVVAGGSGRADLRGGLGNDTLTAGADSSFLVGDPGDDTFIIDGTDTFISGTTFHGSFSSGIGGIGETDTIILRTDNATVRLDSGDSNIDALTFDTGGTTSQFEIRVAPSPTELSETAVITGDASINTLRFVSFSGTSIDLSGFTFNSWTDGVDIVRIEDPTSSASTLTGSVVDDLITSSGPDTLVGLTGDDIFQLNSSTVPVAIHGSAADGTGGGSETDLVNPRTNVDLRTLTFTNIDGFLFVSGGSISFNSTTGAITSRSRVVTADASQIGTDLPTALTAISNNNQAGAFEIFIDTVGGTLDTSTWDTTGLSTSSDLHVTGSTGNDTITGWFAEDIVILGGGADTVSTGDGTDRVFFDHTSSGGALDGGGGTSDRLTLDWTGAPGALTLDLLDPTLSTAGPGGMTITGFEQLTFFGGTGNDVVSGGSGFTDLRGGDGNDTLTGGQSAQLRGEDGNDILTGGESTFFEGGIGDDTFIIDGTDTFITAPSSMAAPATEQAAPVKPIPSRCARPTQPFG